VTFAVLGAGAVAIGGAHLRTLLARPIQYLRGIAYAVALAGANLRAVASNVFYFTEAVVAGRHLQSAGVTHVHSHFSSTVALLLSRVFPIQFSATIHGPAEFDDAAGFYLPEKIARAQFVRAISTYGASQLMRVSDPAHWPKIEVVRLGVDTGIFTPGLVPIDNPPVNLLCVGGLAAAKGHAILIAAIDRLVKEGRTQVQLRLVGDGPMRASLEKMIVERDLTSHVTLEGACDQNQVLDLYRQASLFVLPSFAEGVPVVLMEAMAMEIPCIATWITGVPELIRHGIDGWLIPPGNEEELTASIAQLIDDAELRQRLGRAGRARIKEQYELGRNVECLAEVYRRRLGV
jgi:colanic acid/amylovoran biosynthesis glycosyltransferase